jgi:hypothetical protein
MGKLALPWQRRGTTEQATQLAKEHPSEAGFMLP